MSNRTPMVPLVSFLLNDGSGVIRQAIDRVAIVGSPSAATVIVLAPLPSQGSVRGACWKSFSTSRRIQARPPVSSNREPVSIAAEDPAPSGRRLSSGWVDRTARNRSAKDRPLLVEIETVTWSSADRPSP